MQASDVHNNVRTRFDTPAKMYGTKVTRHVTYHHDATSLFCVQGWRVGSLSLCEDTVNIQTLMPNGWTPPGMSHPPASASSESLPHRALYHKGNWKHLGGGSALGTRLSKSQIYGTNSTCNEARPGINLPVAAAICAICQGSYTSVLLYTPIKMGCGGRAVSDAMQTRVSNR